MKAAKENPSLTGFSADEAVAERVNNGERKVVGVYVPFLGKKGK